MVQYAPGLDLAFGALADPTRRGILDRLATSDASISELADRFDMTLTGVKKHVAILEDAGLVKSKKEGRVRTCTLGPSRLDDETAWIQWYQEMLEARMDRLGILLERMKGSQP